jgi:SAM-dependent methyltransferase
MLGTHLLAGRAREGAVLIGVDFSTVAVQQATDRAALFGLTDRAIVVGDLAATGLADGTADGVVSMDALHFAAKPTAAAREARRLLRPGGRLVMTNWQPRSPATSTRRCRGAVDAGAVVVLTDDRDSVEAVLPLARCLAAAMP